jgi:predicted transcriptional regulator
MKKILISINPKWVKKILNGEKTIEVRRTAPKCELPCEVYIYCTKEKPSLNLWTSKTKEKCRKAILEYNESQADKELDEFINAEFVERYPQYRGERVIFSPQTLNGKVVAKFTLNKVSKIKYSRGTWNCGDIGNHKVLWDRSCLNYLQLEQYLNGEGYAWHIDNLVIFDKPKELKDFKHWVSYKNCNECPYGKKEPTILCATCREKVPLTNAPQSYMFVEVDE